MKKNYVILALIVVAAMVFPTLVGAEGDTLPGSGWWTGQQIMNIGTSNATVVSTAYDALSANTYTAQFFPVVPGGSVTFLPADFVGMGPGFQGSAIVSADQPIKAIVSLTNRQVGSYGIPGGVAGAQYQGIDGTAAATSVRFPIAKRAFGGPPNVKTTTFFVQNAGSAATIVTATYSGCGSHTNNSTSINPGQMVVMNPAAAGVPTGSLCSATMTATQPIAGVAAEHYDVETVATLVQATRGATSADYDTTIYAPIFKKRFPTNPTRSRTTGGQIQNVTAGNINVTGTFRGTGSCAGPYILTITGVTPGAYANFLYPATTPAMPDGCLTSGTFVGTGQIVGIVNESYLDPSPLPGTQSATAYNMAPDNSKTTKAVAPLYKEQFGGKTSGLQAQNVGASNATLHVVFTSGVNTYTTINYVVAPGSSQNFYLVSTQPLIWVGTPMPAGTNASATVISDQPVIVAIAEQAYTVANQNCFGQGSGACYDKQNYEGFNIAP
jgi:hypothetical protein